MNSVPTAREIGLAVLQELEGRIGQSVSAAGIIVGTATLSEPLMKRDMSDWSMDDLRGPPEYAAEIGEAIEAVRAVHPFARPG